MAVSIGMVTIDCLDPRSLAGFWTAALDATVAGDYGDFVLLAGTPALGLQRVSEPRAGKNRVHLDLYTDDRATEVARLTALGTSVLAERNAPGLWWTVLADPEASDDMKDTPNEAQVRAAVYCRMSKDKVGAGLGVTAPAGAPSRLNEWSGQHDRATQGHVIGFRSQPSGERVGR